MKKVFLVLLIGAMVSCCTCGCTCSNQRSEEEVVVESVDSTAVDVLDAADSTLVVE